MNFPALDNIIWAANFLGIAALLVVLLARKRWRQFPIFTCFMAYSIVVSAGMFLVSRYSTPTVYRVAYWTITGGDILFQLGLIFEITRVVLRPTGTWIRDARSSFVLVGVTGTSIAAGLCLAIMTPQGSTAGIWEIRGDLFTALLE